EMKKYRCRRGNDDHKNKEINEDECDENDDKENDDKENDDEKSEQSNKTSLKRYDFAGWSPLRCRYLNIIHGSYENEELLERLVTSKKEIHIKTNHYFEYDKDY